MDPFVIKRNNNTPPYIPNDVTKGVHTLSCQENLAPGLNFTYCYEINLDATNGTIPALDFKMATTTLMNNPKIILIITTLKIITSTMLMNYNTPLTTTTWLLKSQ